MNSSHLSIQGGSFYTPKGRAVIFQPKNYPLAAQKLT
ncbi:hypothetical protein CPL00345_CDS0153 [Klebsiella phage GlastoCabaret]